MTEKQRQAIAEAINNSSNTCWAELAMWMTHPDDYSLDDIVEGGDHCKEESDEIGRCWCGKYLQGQNTNGLTKKEIKELLAPKGNHASDN